jgi:hypothetical protein
MKRSTIVAVAALAAGVFAFVKRPIRHPRSSGTWQPAGKHRSPDRG